jgi:formate-dependent nitrite reductase cytochrome c552 subunit
MSVPKLVQGEGQDRNIFNNVKRTVRDIKQLTNEQLAVLHFESWHEARSRAAGIIEEEIEQ